MCNVNGTACKLRANVYGGVQRQWHTLCVVDVAPGGGLELAFPATAAAVGTHRL